MSASLSRPRYPTWIRSARVRLLWSLGLGVLALGALGGTVWPPALALIALAVPVLAIAIVVTMTAIRLSPRGDDIQARIHALITAEIGDSGPVLDIGCGSGQLAVRLARESPEPVTGLDRWPREWGDYSRELAIRNAAAERVQVEFVAGSASALPFASGSMARVVSCLTFHEVRDVPDRLVCLTEAIRVLAPAGRFVFVDLFDDPRAFGGRDRVLEAIRRAGGTVDAAVPLAERVPLRWPLRGRRVLGTAVLVTGGST